MAIVQVVLGNFETLLCLLGIDEQNSGKILVSIIIVCTLGIYSS
jgi:hypothetical protein